MLPIRMDEICENVFYYTLKSFLAPRLALKDSFNVSTTEYKAEVRDPRAGVTRIDRARVASMKQPDKMTRQMVVLAMRLVVSTQLLKGLFRVKIQTEDGK